MTISVKEFVKGEYLTADDLNAALTTMVDEINRVAALPPEGQKNYIINGDFSVWQRGISQTSSGYGADDRWVNENGGTTKTASQQSFTLGQTDVPDNPKYYSRTVVTSVAGAGNYAVKLQKVEDVTKFSGEEVTLSFWAKADAAKNIAIEFVQVFGTGGSPSTAVNAQGVTTVALTTSWAKYEVTVSLASVSGKTLGTNGNDHTQVLFWMDAGSSLDSRTNSLGQQSGTFDIALVQLEKGDTATDFEYADEATQLARCQRYYVDLMAGDYVTQWPIANLAVWATTEAYGVIHLPVTMRAAPSLEVSNVTHFSALVAGSFFAATDLLLAKAHKQTPEIYITTAGLTVGRAGWLRSNTSSARIAMNAEL